MPCFEKKHSLNKAKEIWNKINGKNTFNLNLRVISHAMFLSVARISLNEAINCLILPQWCHKKHFCDESKIIINAHY